MSVCRSVCQSLCPICLSLSACLFVCLSVFLSVCLSVCPPACLPACLSVSLSLCLSRKIFSTEGTIYADISQGRFEYLGERSEPLFTPIYLSLSLFVPITLSTSVTIPVPNVPEALILKVGQPLVLDCGDAIFTFLIDRITSLLDIEFPFPVLNITSVTLVDTGYYMCVAGGAPRSVTLVATVPSKQCINC